MIAMQHSFRPTNIRKIREHAAVNKTVYIHEMKTTVAGPKPGFVNFIRWLFEPFQPPPPAEPLSQESLESLMAFRAERESRQPPDRVLCSTCSRPVD